VVLKTACWSEGAEEGGLLLLAAPAAWEAVAWALSAAEGWASKCRGCCGGAVCWAAVLVWLDSVAVVCPSGEAEAGEDLN